MIDDPSHPALLLKRAPGRSAFQLAAAQAAAQPMFRASGVSKAYCRRWKESQRYGLRDMFSALLGRKPGQRALRSEEFWALRNVDFEIPRGQSLGVIGDNGAGKSTLLKLLMGRLRPDAGTIDRTGRVVAITELGLGFNPLLSGRENIFLNAALLGMPRRVTGERLATIIDFADLHEFIEAPVQTYSSGMRARLGFAIASHVDADALLLDEVFAVGDLSFRRKCRRRLVEFRQAGGTIVLVSHDMQAVQTLCDLVLVLDHGQVVFAGDVTEGIHCYFARHREDSIATPVAAAPAVPATSGEVSHAPLRLTEPDSAPQSVVAKPATARAEAADDGHGGFVWRPTAGQGNGAPIRIESLTIRPSQQSALRHGGDAEIELQYVADNPAAAVVWGVSICTDDMATHVASALCGFDRATREVLAGHGTFRCRLKKLPLHAGVYALKAGIADAGTGAALADVGWECDPLYFSVQAIPSRLANMHALMGDLVGLEVDWLDEPQVS